MKAQVKRTILTIVFFCFLVTLAASPLQAETTTTDESVNTTTQEYRDEIKTIKEDRQELIQEKRTENKEARKNAVQQIQEKRQEFRSEVSQKHADRLQNRFSAYYERLSKLLTKIQERMNILSGQGKNVQEAQSKVDEAEESLQQAKELGDEAIAKFNSIDPAKYQEQRAVALEAKDLAQQARTEYLKSLSLMKEAVQLLKRLITNI